VQAIHWYPCQRWQPTQACLARGLLAERERNVRPRVQAPLSRWLGRAPGRGCRGHAGACGLRCLQRWPQPTRPDRQHADPERQEGRAAGAWVGALATPRRQMPGALEAVDEACAPVGVAIAPPAACKDSGGGGTVGTTACQPTPGWRAARVSPWRTMGGLGARVCSRPRCARGPEPRPRPIAGEGVQLSV
jgi:hypothetical protein